MHMNKEQFLQLLHEQQTSGLSVKAYCKEHGISQSTFYFWKRKFQSSPISVEGASGLLVPVQVQSHRASQVASSGVVVSFPNGVQVEFASSSDQVAILMLNTMCMSYV